MSNSTKAGRIDRRIPVPGNGVFVVDELDKVYRGSVVYDRAKMEVDAIRSAYDHLEGKDQETIKGFVDKFDSNKYTDGCTRIKGFGKIAVLEVVAKVGIFLNAAGWAGEL